MNKFINRLSELQHLRTLFTAENAGLAIVYGRRRLGKTRLLKEFSQIGAHCYFMADKAGETSQRRLLAMAMAEALDEPLLQSANFANWYDLFEAFDTFRPANAKFLLILDEYQYLCQVQPAFSSFIQKYWDEHWQHSNIMLVLCGSVTSMMYRETMAISSPLYGRASVQMLLEPIRYQHIREFLPGRSDIELINMYSLTGGVPRYLELARGYDSFAEALRHLALSRSGILYQEARYLLNEEISKPNVCWSILNALGNGSGRISELGAVLQLPANQLTRYIELLRDLFLIFREVPVLEKNPQKSKKGFYQVADPFLRLWFGAIYPYESFLEFDQVELVEERLKPLLQSHIAYCYEKICRDYVKYTPGAFGCLRVGRQWGKHYDIDVAGVDIDNKLIVAGECKWSKRQVGLSVLQALQKKITTNKLPVSADCKFLLFSKSGFSKELKDAAIKDDKITLVDSIFQ